MIDLISPEQFKTIPWKNGLGETTELAISNNSTLERFDWRISIATVTHNGPFSNFSGYDRNLVLIHGHGIVLQHTKGNSVPVIDKLDRLLMMSSFDGGNQTMGQLIEGTIKDFNIMTDQQRFTAKVTTSLKKHTINLVSKPNHLYFAYSLLSPIQLLEVESRHKSARNQLLPIGHLLKITANEIAKFQLIGEQIIFIEISPLADASSNLK